MAPSRMLVLQDQSGCRFGEKCSFAHRQVDEQPTKRSKTNNDKSAVAVLKKGNWQEREPVTDGCHDRPGKLGKRGYKKLGQNSSKRQSSDARQLGCVFQDMTPPKSILRKSTDMPRPIQRVKFTKAIHCASLKFETKILRSVTFAQVNLISVAPTLQFEDRSQEETEWQEQGAREAPWKLSKNVLKLKEHQRAAFFSPSENRCLPASNLKPEEREFVVDSGASMHMISKKDLSDAEMDTLTKSCSPTIVITANGEVQTHEEAIVYVKEYCRLESFAMKTGIPTNGSMVKNHISLKTEFGYLATRRTSFPLRFQACQVLPRRLHQLHGHPWNRGVILLHFLHPHLLHQQ